LCILQERRRSDRRDTSRERSGRKDAESSLNTETKKSSSRYQTLLIQDILHTPGRNKRPHQIVIILRGLPGSGKSFVAKLIKVRVGYMPFPLRLILSEPFQIIID